MLVPRVFAQWLLARRFEGYKPQPVTPQSIAQWREQFDGTDQRLLLQLLEHVVYFSEADVRRMLMQLNDTLLSRLAKAGITPDHVIYVHIAEPGSSSSVMLNMLRDSARLQQKNCRFVDGRDAVGLNEKTAELGQGAIVYVDDFAGTGDQFSPAHEFAAQYIVGTFSEFYLVPCMCEEALITVGKLGVEPLTKKIHAKDDRPLHDNSTIFDPQSKQRLIELSLSIDADEGLGYGGLATMVVFFHNAPDTTPLLLRGSLGQQPVRGVLPRTTDLPALPAR